MGAGGISPDAPARVDDEGPAGRARGGRDPTRACYRKTRMVWVTFCRHTGQTRALFFAGQDASTQVEQSTWPQCVMVSAVAINY